MKRDATFKRAASFTFMCVFRFSYSCRNHSNLIIYCVCAHIIFFVRFWNMRIMTRWKIVAFCANVRSCLIIYDTRMPKISAYIKKWIAIRMRKWLHVKQIAFDQVIIPFRLSMTPTCHRQTHNVQVFSIFDIWVQKQLQVQQRQIKSPNQCGKFIESKELISYQQWTQACRNKRFQS